MMAGRLEAQAVDRLIKRYTGLEQEHFNRVFGDLLYETETRPGALRWM